MPRTRTFPPYPARPHASGQARIRVGPKTHYLGLHGSPESHAEYARLAAEWRASGAAGPLAACPSAGRTVGDLIAAFFRHAEDHYRRPDGSPGTEYDAYRLSCRPLRHLYGTTPAADFGPLALKAVRQLMVDGYDHPKHGPQPSLARKVVNQRVGRVRRLFRWAASEELVPAEVYLSLKAVQGLQAGRSKAAECPPVGPAPAAAVARAARRMGRTVRAMVRLQRRTGMRPGEVCALTPGEIDRQGVVVDGVRVWVYWPARHKTAWRGHRRAVPLGPRAQAVLRRYLDGPAGRPCFLTGRGRPWTADSYGKAVRRACRQVGTEVWSPNQLRHAVGTDVEASDGLDAARAVLGHRTPVVTKIYASADLQIAARIAAKNG